jgi:hypothetical protein
MDLQTDNMYLRSKVCCVDAVAISVSQSLSLLSMQMSFKAVRLIFKLCNQ